MKPRRRNENTLLYGVTADISAWALLKGQLADMKSRGWNVVVVSNGGDRLLAVSNREGVRAVSLPMAREVDPKADLVALLAWLRLLRRERPAVVNIGTPKAALLGGLAAVATGVPRRVYVVRGLRYEGASGRRQSLLKAMERLTLACATDVVVVSRSMGEQLLGDRLTKKPLLLVGDGSSNGVDGVALSDLASSVSRDDVRRELGIAPDVLLVGFVGRVTEDKGADMLVSAIRQLQESGVAARLVVVGEAEDEDAAGRLGAVPDTVVTGWTDEPWRYLTAMDVLALPTRREGYPNVVLEANACGVPVVTTKATGAIDSVADGETGLVVDVDDASGMAVALTRLAHDEQARTSMARAAHKRALERFAPSRIWDGLDGIYRGRRSSDVAEIS